MEADDTPVGIAYEPFESKLFDAPSDDEDAIGPAWTAEAEAALGFDIDDKGRKEAVVSLSDGTRLHLIQETFVDWRSGTKVAVVLKGWLNRRTQAGQVPSGAYDLRMSHAVRLETRKIGKTTPPIDFSPLSDGRSGFFVNGASLTHGSFLSETFSARSNSLRLHYIGSFLIEAAGEPADNPILKLSTHLNAGIGTRSFVTPTYSARRGGA